ncbi:unnamed protein product [Closterium sp. Naga37s-1]|nr:unnamed protein product [Closterium sp. Naga37s-1]
MASPSRPGAASQPSDLESGPPPIVLPANAALRSPPLPPRSATVAGRPPLPPASSESGSDGPSAASPARGARSPAAAYAPRPSASYSSPTSGGNGYSTRPAPPPRAILLQRSRSGVLIGARSFGGTQLPWEPPKRKPPQHTAEVGASDAVAQSLDYELEESEEARAADKLGLGEAMEYTAAKWVLVLLIGCMTGGAAFLINMVVENIMGVKLALTISLLNGGSPFLAVLVYSLLSALLVAASAALCVFVAPAAAGSGIPEVRAYLNGVDMPQVLSPLTLLVKILGSMGAEAGGLALGKEGGPSGAHRGSMGAEAGGLALGKEGPLVHIGAAIAALFGRGSIRDRLARRAARVVGGGGGGEGAGGGGGGGGNGKEVLGAASAGGVLRAATAGTGVCEPLLAQSTTESSTGRGGKGGGEEGGRRRWWLLYSGWLRFFDNDRARHDLVTIGAGAGLFYSDWLCFFGNDRARHDLVTIGAGAGVAAAFQCPLGGILFALEELTSCTTGACSTRAGYVSSATTVRATTSSPLVLLGGVCGRQCPLGGILFALEELISCTGRCGGCGSLPVPAGWSSLHSRGTHFLLAAFAALVGLHLRWKKKVVWKALFTNAVGAIALRALMAACQGGQCGLYSDGGFILFDAQRESDFGLRELLPVLVLGITGGLVGALFNTAVARLSKLRAKYINPLYVLSTDGAIHLYTLPLMPCSDSHTSAHTSAHPPFPFPPCSPLHQHSYGPWCKVLEAALIAILTSLTRMALPFAPSTFPPPPPPPQCSYGPWCKVLEAALIAILTSLARMALPFASRCLPCPENEVCPDPSLNGNYIAFTCPAGSYNPMAGLAPTTNDNAITNLFSSSPAQYTCVFALYLSVTRVRILKSGRTGARPPPWQRYLTNLLSSSPAEFSRCTHARHSLHSRPPLAALTPATRCTHARHSLHSRPPLAALTPATRCTHARHSLHSRPPLAALTPATRCTHARHSLHSRPPLAALTPATRCTHARHSLHSRPPLAALTPATRCTHARHSLHSRPPLAALTPATRCTHTRHSLHSHPPLAALTPATRCTHTRHSLHSHPPLAALTPATRCTHTRHSLHSHPPLAALTPATRCTHTRHSLHSHPPLAALTPATRCTHTRHSLHSHPPLAALTPATRCTHTRHSLHSHPPLAALTPATRCTHTRHSLHSHPPLAALTPATRCTHTRHSLHSHPPLAALTPATRCTHTRHSLHSHPPLAALTPATRCTHTRHSLHSHPPLAALTPATRCTHTRHSLHSHPPLAALTPATRCTHTRHSLHSHPPLAALTPATRCTHTPTRCTHTRHSLHSHPPLAALTPATRCTHTRHSLHSHPPLAALTPATRCTHTRHSLHSHPPLAVLSCVHPFHQLPHTFRFFLITSPSFPIVVATSHFLSTTPLARLHQWPFPICFPHPPNHSHTHSPSSSFSFFPLTALAPRAPHVPPTRSHATLAIFFLVFFSLAIITNGCSVPAGLFVPLIVAGGTYGRMMGKLMRSLTSSSSPTLSSFLLPSLTSPLRSAGLLLFGESGSDTGLDEGTYALLGAASLLGGSMRMSVSLSVMLLEVTGNLLLLPLIMLATTIAKEVGDCFNEGVVDEASHLKRLPMLEYPPPEFMKNLTAIDGVRGPAVALKSVERVGEVLRVLQTTTHSAFPVVQIVAVGEGGRLGEREEEGGGEGEGEEQAVLYGMVLRSKLLKLLADKSTFQRGTLCTARNNPLYKLPLSTNAAAGAVPEPRPATQRTVRFEGVPGSPEAANGEMPRGTVEGGYAEGQTPERILAKSLSHKHCTATAIVNVKKTPCIEDIDLSAEEQDMFLDLHPFCNTSPHVVGEAMSLRKAYAIFRRMGLRHLCVVRERMQVVGVLTRKDLLPHSFEKQQMDEEWDDDDSDSSDEEEDEEEGDGGVASMNGGAGVSGSGGEGGVAIVDRAIVAVASDGEESGRRGSGHASDSEGGGRRGSGHASDGEGGGRRRSGHASDSEAGVGTPRRRKRAIPSFISRCHTQKYH